MKCREDHRDEGGQPQCLGAAFSIIDVDHRRQTQTSGRQHGTQFRQHRRVLAGNDLGQLRQAIRQTAQRRDELSEVARLGRVGKTAFPDEEPHLLERSRAGELGGVVCAVVEEAAVAVDRSDRGLGCDDAVESGGYIDELGHGLSVRSSTSVINID